MQGTRQGLMKRAAGVCLLAAWLVGGFSASAQYPLGGPVNIGPFVGYRTGGQMRDARTGESADIDGSPAYGLVFDWTFPENLTGPTRQIEFLWSRQDSEVAIQDIETGQEKTDIAIDYFHVGGVLEWDADRFEPYVALTAGATVVSPSGDAGSDTALSLGGGGGGRFWFSDYAGFRADVRGYLTFVGDGDSAFSSERGLGLTYDGDTLWQFEATAGLLVRF